MRPKPLSAKKPAEQVVKDIRRATRRHFSAEDKIRIVLDGLRGEDSIAELCRKEGIAQSLYYTWSKEFMEAGKRRLAGGFILRLALALEHLRWCATPFANSANSFPTLVSLDALQSAIRLIDDWAVPMARRAFGTAGISHEEADAAALARWLKRNGCRKFNSRQLRRQSNGPSGRLAKTTHMDASCKRLEDAGLIRHAPSRAGDKPGRTRLDYDVNPKLLEC